MISAIETKLIPRQSPQSPPKPEMKSNHVIFGILSNSEMVKLFANWDPVVQLLPSCYKISIKLCGNINLNWIVWIKPTIDRWLSEEEIQNSYVLLVGIVVSLTLVGGENRTWCWQICKTLVRKDISSFSPIKFGYFSLNGPNVWLT